MFINDSAIANWRDLQDKVAQLFSELDCTVTTPHRVNLAGRGQKEVDVFVEDRRTSIPQIIIIECKWWDSSVPQDTVHSFHTVMQGCGANAGIIVSKVGFQSGAYEATQYTNIVLLTFEALQHRFGHEWFAAQRNKIASLREPLRTEGKLHFDQFSLLPIHNNRIFHTEELDKRMLILHSWWGSLLGEASSRWPESYLGPEPVKMARHPLRPFAEMPEGQMWHETESVREYFRLLIAGLKAWNTAFKRLKNKAHASFEALPDEEQERLMARSLELVREETPFRVLKNKVPEAEYQRLLSLILTR